MKKLIYGMLFLALVGIGVVGCKKEVIQKPLHQNESSSSEFNISSDGKMLIFKTTDDYRKVLNYPTPEIKSKFMKEVANLKYTSYAERLSCDKSSENDNLLGNDDLAQILNEDWIVQIGEYLYRVNKPTESVYVLPASNVDQYEDLVNENKSNKNIRKFSTEDDVIELAENGAEGQKGLFCNESQASNPDWVDETWSAYEPYTQPVANSNKQYVRRYRRIAKMNYLKLGIYFNLQAKLEVVGYVTTSASNTGTYGIDSFQTLNCVTSIRSKRIYKIRCQNETGWYSVLSILTNGTDLHKTEYNSYQGSKGINKFWLKCGFYYQTHPNNSSIAVYPTNLGGETLYQRETKSGY